MIHPRTLHALEYDKIIQYFADLCVSAPGRKNALELKPFSAKAEAEAALALYSEYLIWNDSFEAVRIPSFPDVSGILDFFPGETSPLGKSLDLDAFWALREMLRVAESSIEAIKQPQAPDQWPGLLLLATGIPFPASLLAALNRCISDDGFLKDGSSPELWRIRNELRGLHQNCLRRVKDFAKQYNIQHYLQDEYMTLASDRYVLPLKANFKGKLQGILHDWSQTGETCYFEPIFLVEINNRLRELKREERAEEVRILDYLATLLMEEFAGVKNAFQLLGELDFLNAKKLLGAYLDCVQPAFTSPDEGVELFDARHPLLTLARQGEGEGVVHPLNILLPQGKRTLIITGGNAGGKTVCLKTLGLIAAMAMSGLPVPAAKGSHLPWFNRVDAFIGDEQSLDDNVSTFTAQIEHLAKAWKHLDNLGLVLLDEFGAGTDPAEGAALAQAVLDGLIEKDCFTLCATHFPALKAYALTRPGVSAASMLFDPKTNRPLYKLAYGQVGESHALAVAREYGLPESILEDARKYLLCSSEDSSAVISRLNELAIEREDEIETLKKERAKNSALLEEKRQKLDKEKSHLQEGIRNDIARIMSEWRQEKLSAKQAARQLSGLRGSLLGSGNPEPEIKTSFQAGQQVFHKTFNKKGVILELDERRKRARIDLDGVSLWTELKDIEAAQNSQKKQMENFRAPAMQASLILDVRGQRSYEALANVGKFLDEALLAGYGELEIIHGRGTGALRKEIHAFLKDNSAVASLRLAPEDRGGDGMTIVTLK